MSETPANVPPTPKSLQFDVATPAAPSGSATGAAANVPTCARCTKPITGEYYTVTGETGGTLVYCATCRQEAEGQVASGASAGSFGRAVLFGSGAAALGATIWYAVSALTGWNFGLIAILVGFLVGTAVNKGSRGRGGRRYQLLAVGLTYAAITVSYVPIVLKELGESQTKSDTTRTAVDSLYASGTRDSIAAASAAAPTTTATAVPPAADSAPASTAAPAAVPASATAGAKADSASASSVGVGAMMLGLLVIFLIAAAGPVLAVFSEPQAIISLAIIGFGLYEAWKLNRRTTLAFRGPYVVGGPTGAPGLRA